MPFMPLRLSSKGVGVFYQPLLAPGFADGTLKSGIGYCRDINPKSTSCVERIGIERQRCLSFCSSYHASSSSIPHSYTDVNGISSIMFDGICLA